MKKVILALIETSTAYGLPNIVRSRRLFNKLFWLTFIVLSLTAATYYIVNDLEDYFNFEVVTTVKTEYDQPTEFPTISFCSRQRNLYDTINPFTNESQQFFSDTSVKKNPNNHLESYVSSFFGRCFRFNSGKNLTNHSIPIKKSTSASSYDYYYLYILAPKGLLVWIHNKSSLPKFERNLILLSPGIMNNIEVERTFESKLEEPFNNCLKDVSNFKKNKTLIDYFLNRNLIYSQESCLDLCFDLFYINENPCQCQGSDIGNVFEKCLMTFDYEIYDDCTWNYRSNFTKNNLVEKCSDYCPLECDSFSLSYSISTFSGSFTINQTNFTEIYFYYKTLKYKTVVQEPKMKWQQLISNLGGYLGLFVGLSFVSLFEITEIFIEIVFILTRKQNVKQTQMHHDNRLVSMPELEILKTELETLKLEMRNKTLDIQSELTMHRIENNEKIKRLDFLYEIFRMKLQKKN